MKVCFRCKTITEKSTDNNGSADYDVKLESAPASMSAPSNEELNPGLGAEMYLGGLTKEQAQAFDVGRRYWLEFSTVDTDATWQARKAQTDEDRQKIVRRRGEAGGAA